LKRLLLYRDHEHVDFAYGLFLLNVLVQSVAWAAGCWFFWNWLRPDIAQAQISHPIGVVFLWFAGIHLGLGLFEYLFHRYVLHRVFWRPLKPMRDKHTAHHSLTHVRELAHTADETGSAEVRNKYPIVEPEQIEHSAFPPYAITAFQLLFSIVFIPMQLALPGAPILLAGSLAVIFSYCLYEIKHAVEHNDYESFWKTRVERSRFYRTWYGFHLMHHSRIGVNQAIGGVFALPIWDWAFGTCFIPRELPLPGARVSPESQEPPPPRWPISALDRAVERLEQRIKEKRKRAALLKHDQSAAGSVMAKPKGQR
jgi:hemolysin III